jgi:acetyl-CoA synthetase
MTTEDRVAELLAVYGSPHANAAELLCDRHPDDDVAFTVVDGDLSSRELTYGHLRQESTRFAAALAELGVEPGDAVAALMGKSTDLVVALLGIWRRGAVHVPLFTAFAPPAIALRLQASNTKVVVVDADQRTKLQAGPDMLADAPWRVIVAGGEPQGDELSLSDLLAAHAPDDPAGAPVAVGGDGVLVLLFTSGTTGTPKGVPVPVKALASFVAYLEFGLDVTTQDVFWNAADPGWAYGLYYAVLGPLAAGIRSLLLHAGFSAPLTYQVMQRYSVTNFAAAPTVYRSLRADPAPVPNGLRLRRASSAGEPLTPEVIGWAEGQLGVPVPRPLRTDRARHGDRQRLGRRRPGGPATGLDGPAAARLVDRRPGRRFRHGAARRAARPRRDPRSGQPADVWFSGYVNAPDKTAERFTDDGQWYLTGDAGSADQDGWFYFSSRDDDIIIMAGYRIGPFDVESVLVMHPRVVEAVVIGVPDELRGEVLEAFVVTRPGDTGDDQLVEELQQLVKHKFAAHAYPRTVHFVDALPKTSSGKVQRYVLRQHRRQQLAP